MRLTTALSSTISIALLCSSLVAGGKQASPDQTPEPSPNPPQTYGILLFRAFELLDVFGPLEALSLLATRTNLTLYLLSETLSPVSTQPLLPAMNPFNSTFFPTINPTHTLDTAPLLDVLIVPGGLGTRSPYLNLTLEYIKTVYPSLDFLLTICTGSALVAKTGLLDGRRATTNKAAWNGSIANAPNVHWVPRARWVVDGNIWTSSGVSAGIDATLAFIKEYYGREEASEIADLMEYVWHEDPDWDPFADVWDVPGA
ncbi:DJ-1/PfpI family protein [Aspergillus cavernicola]|uniref:DJ-1/PfpI family protein n=1 Tax=Aspergillus cavernicola TaxID=176166 RepID=A0ABR4IA42_9EURO